MEQITEIIKLGMIEMFRRVGLDYTWDAIRAYEKSYPMWSRSEGRAAYHDWYLSYRWTRAQEDDFGEWLNNLFYKSKVFKHYSAAARRRQIAKQVGYFLLLWGWLTDEREEN